MLSNGIKYFPRLSFKVQRSRSNYDKYEVEYLINGTRLNECQKKLEK